MTVFPIAWMNPGSRVVEVFWKALEVA